ncbi:MAG: hypothetical protein AB7O96_12660 [Pseudobdellovibrionaceae bacterium]
MLRIFTLLIIAGPLLAGCKYKSDASRGIGNGGKQARSCSSKSGCKADGSSRRPDSGSKPGDGGGTEPGDGDGGKNPDDGNGGNCRQERFCDRNGCENRPICSSMVFNVEAKEQWGKEFGLSASAVKKLDQVLATSRTGDSSALQEIGLTERDVRKMVRFEMPTDAAIKEVAKSFGITTAQSRAFLSFMIGTVHKQAKNIQSPLWKNCLASGHWVTPENNTCKKTYWKGCSPETGATMCVSY